MQPPKREPDHLAPDGGPDLDALYDSPSPIVTRAITNHLTEFHFAYLEAASFLCLATGNGSGLDVSPHGGSPGFVHALDAGTIAFADWPGNNRIESLRNLADDPRIGLLFLFPGIDIFMRINGQARLSTAPSLLQRLAEGTKRPKLAVVVRVEEALFHCGKAINRARLWNDASHIPPRSLPSPGAMMKALAEIEDMNADELDRFYADGIRQELY